MTRDQLIMQFFDGELDQAEQAQARELLVRDPEARALLARLELVSSLVGEIGDAQPTLPDISHAVMDRVLREAAPVAPPAVPLRLGPRRALVGVTAVLALAAGFALLVSRHESGSALLDAPDIAAPAGAVSALEPDPPGQSVAIERIDFGEDPGAIFLVPGVDERTVVVWTMDATADNGPEIEL